MNIERLKATRAGLNESGMKEPPSGLIHLVSDLFDVNRDAVAFLHLDQQDLVLGVFPNGMAVIDVKSSSREVSTSTLVVYPYDRIEIEYEGTYKTSTYMSPGQEAVGKLKVLCLKLDGSVRSIEIETIGTADDDYFPALFRWLSLLIQTKLGVRL